MGPKGYWDVCGVGVGVGVLPCMGYVAIAVGKSMVFKQFTLG